MKHLLLIIIVLASLNSRAQNFHEDWQHPFNSPQDVIEGYQAKYRQLGPIDPRGLFLQVYLEISLEMIEMMKRHEFQNQEWIQSLMVTYANLYRESFYAAEMKDQNMSSAWKTAFFKPNNGRRLPSTDLLLSINAHVNRDLPFALDRISTHFDDATMEKDFKHISEAFTRRWQNLWFIMRSYEKCQHPAVEKELLKQLILGIMGSRRDRTWREAQKYQKILNQIERENLMKKELEAYALIQTKQLLGSARLLAQIEHQLCW